MPLCKELRLLVTELPHVDKETLGQLADKFREKYPEKGICVIGSVQHDQVTLMATVTQDVIKLGIKAGELVTMLSRQLGSGGGGAPHLAFGGGRDVEKLPEALAGVCKWVDAKM